MNADVEVVTGSPLAKLKASKTLATLSPRKERMVKAQEEGRWLARAKRFDMKAALSVPQYPLEDPEYLKRFDHWKVGPDIARARTITVWKQAMQKRLKVLVAAKDKELALIRERESLLPDMNSRFTTDFKGKQIVVRESTDLAKLVAAETGYKVLTKREVVPLATHWGGKARQKKEVRIESYRSSSDSEDGQEPSDAIDNEAGDGSPETMDDRIAE